MMYKVGLTMKSMYKGFLGDYTDENVHVSSTLISRTIMSALTVMAGMFPPPKPILDHLDWQPVPVWQDSTEFDKVYVSMIQFHVSGTIVDTKHIYQGIKEKGLSCLLCAIVTCLLTG